MSGFNCPLILVTLTKVRAQFVGLGGGGVRAGYSSKSARSTLDELGPDLRQDDGVLGGQSSTYPHPAIPGDNACGFDAHEA